MSNTPIFTHFLISVGVYLFYTLLLLLVVVVIVVFFQLSLYSQRRLLLSFVLHYKKIMEYFLLKSDEIKALQQILT